MKNINYKSLTKKINKVAVDASKIYLNKSFKEEVKKHKFTNDDVTNLDIATQDFIKKRCLSIIKDVNFIGEEGSLKRNNKFTFVVDPIDGTFNFKHNISNFGTQIVLLENNKPIISSLYLPVLKKLFFANKYGAFEGNKKISVSEVIDFNEAVIAVGDFVQHGSNFEKQQEYMTILSNNFKRIRMFGSSCMDNCMLASGKVDAYIIYSSNKWDLLPGQFLVESAGGVVVSNEEGNIYISGNIQIVEKLKLLLSL